MAVWPVTTPRTWVGGELVDAATMNIDIRDRANQIAAGSVAVDQVQLAGASGPPSVAGSGKAVIAFDTTAGQVVMSRSTGAYHAVAAVEDENTVIAMEVFG